MCARGDDQCDHEQITARTRVNSRACINRDAGGLVVLIQATFMGEIGTFPMLGSTYISSIFCHIGVWLVLILTVSSANAHTTADT